MRAAMAQEEPLYDFPEPTQLPQRKLLGHQRGRGSLRSISVLDRLLLTVPVWFQLSINPATALHILQREPPGTFLVRRSRTSKRNVLCVRLADDNVPSFVQQFGIREEPSSKTMSLETSTISFPDLPRLISFYCVSRDVLRFPLELPEAIAKATSHKELESISHMGIEFWNSHLNVRGPRESPKPQKDGEKTTTTDVVTSDPPASAPQASSAAQPDSAPKPDPGNPLETGTPSDPEDKRAGSNPTVFHEFCPIATRSPRELDCGSGQGALCFINPLFLQSLNPLCKRRMFSRSLRVRISTESSSLLSPPHAPPPPPPLMPKTKRKCGGPRRGQGAGGGEGASRGGNPSEAGRIDHAVPDTLGLPPAQMHSVPGEARVQLPAATPHLHPERQQEPGPDGAGVVLNLDHAQASPTAASSTVPSLSPYISPAAPLLFPKVSSCRSPYDSPGASPSLSPYQSPSLSPKAPVSLSPYDSPSASPSLSPSPSPSPKVPFALSPFTSPSFLRLEEQVYHAPSARPDRVRSEREAEKDGAGPDESGTKEELHKKSEEEESGLVLQMKAASLNDTGGLQGAAETSAHEQDKATSL
uniref:ras and Rab interactor 1-like isoform X1 n=1 Tax=Gasterosteus aculeatus aculeatus TaxID=481459 RepID=UPI001A97EE45|nr:ras and Rab interactor 1-like isoform X1 [Gasterosteus aculeatus aculeatus]